MIIRLLTTLILLAIFGTLFFLYHSEVQLGKLSSAWPTTLAKVEEATWHRKKRHVRYSYKVDGVDYVGRKLEFIVVANKELKTFFDSNLKVKGIIPISYSPKNHSISVIRAGMDNRQYLGYSILVLTYLVFALSIDGFLRKLIKKFKENRTGAST